MNGYYNGETTQEMNLVSSCLKYIRIGAPGTSPHS